MIAAPLVAPLSLVCEDLDTESHIVGEDRSADGLESYTMDDCFRKVMTIGHDWDATGHERLRPITVRISGDIVDAVRCLDNEALDSNTRVLLEGVDVVSTANHLIVQKLNVVSKSLELVCRQWSCTEAGPNKVSTRQ